MGILVNFEDTYGVADIVCHRFFGELLNIAGGQRMKEFEDVCVQVGLASAAIFSPRPVPATVTTIIYVYDMDRQSIKDEYNFLEPSTLKVKLDLLKKYYRDKQLYFVPVAFSAETVCLYQLYSGINFSEMFSRSNTARLHTDMLVAKLSKFHSDKNKPYWSIHGKGKTTLNVKRTRLFFNDFKIDLGSLVRNKLVGINYVLFDWLASGVKNVSVLLSAEEAVDLQYGYKSSFDAFLGRNEVEVVFDNVIYKVT